MIKIDPDSTIEENKLHFNYIQSSGPGGQNVNKVATAVQLRFSLEGSSISEKVKTRLRRLAGKRLADDDSILIQSKRFRTRERNRQAAIQKLVELVSMAAITPKERKKSKPSKAAKERRLKNKKMRGETKKARRDVTFD